MQPVPQLDLEFLQQPPQFTDLPARTREKPEVADTKIPIPDPSYLTTTLPAIPQKQRSLETTKYAKEYDAFCQWAALPKEERKPKMVSAFEKKWGLPYNYTSYFRQKTDYQEKRMRYHYEWIMGLWPDLVFQAYKRAMKNSTADFRVLAEIVGKSMDIGKPQVTVSPMMLIGVPKESLDKLFEKKEYAQAVQGEVVDKD